MYRDMTSYTPLYKQQPWVRIQIGILVQVRVGYCSEILIDIEYTQMAYLHYPPFTTMILVSSKNTISSHKCTSSSLPVLPMYSYLATEWMSSLIRNAHRLYIWVGDIGISSS